jgi:hypothetical protein
MIAAYVRPDRTPAVIPLICCSDRENPFNINKRPAVEIIIEIIITLSMDSLSSIGDSTATKMGAV